MSVVSGPSGLPIPSDITSLAQTGEKRKRSQEVNGVVEQKLSHTTDGDIESEETKRRRFSEFLIDLLEVLRAHDTTPSILEFPIKPTVDNGQSAKRLKLSTPYPATSLASQIEMDAYHTIEELIADIDVASSSLESNGSALEEMNDEHQHASYINKNQSLSVQIAAFKNEVGSLIRCAIAQTPNTPVISSQGPVRAATDTSGNSESRKGHTLPHSESTGKLVLTLYGSVSTPRQLFSSLQQHTRLSSSKGVQASEHDLTLGGANFRLATNQTTPPIREFALPNGISTTKIIPVHSEDLGSSKGKRLTFGDLFAPPPNVPSLNPPKQSRYTATRSQSVNWYNPAEAIAPPKARGRETFTRQQLDTGRWLTYNVVLSPTQPSSPGEKRKQRDRALSSGEAEAALPDEMIAAHQHAKEDALFKSVYSSFAPDHDDSAAVVPQQLKNRLWWERFGESKYLSMRPRDSAVQSEDGIESNKGVPYTGKVNEDQLFEEAVEAFEPEEISLELSVTKKPAKEDSQAEKAIEEILSEISQLLETLSSYQRIRNLSLAPNTRTNTGQNSQLTAMSGGPASPSTAEFDMYNILRSQLVVMISALPPYAMAKLDGDQLGALNISARVQIEGTSHKGTMEDNDYTTRTRQPALTAVTGSTTRTVTPQMTVISRNTHYQATNTSGQRAGYATAARPSAPSASYPSHQYSGRPPASNHYSSYSTQPQPTPVRQSYSAHQYGPQTPQNHNSQYTNSHRQFQNHNGYSAYGQQYATASATGSPAPIAGSQLQRPTQPGYQQRAQNSHGYSYAPTPSGGSSSPQNPATYMHAQQARPQYYGPNANQAQSRPPQFYPLSGQNNPANTNNIAGASAIANASVSANSNALQANGAVKTIGDVVRFSLTAEEQADVMFSQKQALERQHQDNSTIHVSSAVPMANGVEGGRKSNGTPIPQQNGVTAGHI